MDFDATHLPDIPNGWTRDYFFYADGFAKDMDFYAAHGDTVAPLPFHTPVPYPYPEGRGISRGPGASEVHARIQHARSRRAAGATFRFEYPKRDKNETGSADRPVENATQAQPVVPPPDQLTD